MIWRWSITSSVIYRYVGRGLLSSLISQSHWLVSVLRGTCFVWKESFSTVNEGESVLFSVSFTPTWQNVSMSISRSSGACNLKMSSADVTDYPGKRILHFNKRFDLWSLRKINAKNANECEDLEGNAEIYLCDNVKSLDENVSKIGNVASDFS